MEPIASNALAQWGAVGVMFGLLLYDRIQMQKQIKGLLQRQDDTAERNLRALEGVASGAQTTNAVLQDLKGATANTGQTLLSLFALVTRSRDTP